MRWIVKDGNRPRGPRGNFWVLSCGLLIYGLFFLSSGTFYFLSDLHSCTTKLYEPRVLYVCCTASREFEGWWSDSFHRSHLRVWSWVVLSPRVLYVCIPHVEYARLGYTPFKRRVSKVGRCPCNGLTHGCRFYSERWCMWTLSWVLTWKVRCVLWSSAGTLTMFVSR
jgi:hypothetical protein